MKVSSHVGSTTEDYEMHRAIARQKGTLYKLQTDVSHRLQMVSDRNATIFWVAWLLVFFFCVLSCARDVNWHRLRLASDT